jgi:hypothetical protein
VLQFVANAGTLRQDLFKLEKIQKPDPFDIGTDENMWRADAKLILNDGVT